MACTSEREKQALISEGVHEKRLFVTGQPLQTLNDSLFSQKADKPVYPILILAGVGPLWLQNLYVDMLRHSQHLKAYHPIYLRPHPAMNSKGKKLWSYNENLSLTSSRESLGESVSKSELVITFSIDALMVAVRQTRPTIVCIPKTFFVPEWHDFLLSLPRVKVVKTPPMLDEALMDKNFRYNKKHCFSENQWKYVDYAFGDLNTTNNLKKLLIMLSKESTLEC